VVAVDVGEAHLAVAFVEVGVDGDTVVAFAVEVEEVTIRTNLDLLKCGLWMMRVVRRLGLRFLND